MALTYTSRLFGSSSGELTETLYAIPEGNYMEALSEIITRHRNYAVAKANGQLGTCTKTLKKLTQNSKIVQEAAVSRQKGRPECYGTCSLCLETMRAGDRVVTLPCGHTFHASTGHHSGCSHKTETLEGEGEVTKVGCKRSAPQEENGCRGISYWLKNNTSCPQCRHNLPTALPEPTKSESILIPLLHRQNRLISRQAELVQEQQKQIEHLQRCLASRSGSSSRLQKRRKVEMFSPFGGSVQIETQTTTSPDNVAIRGRNTQSLAIKAPQTQLQHNFYLPRLSWQNSASPSQQTTRRRILCEVTTIALKDIVVRGTMDEQAKKAKLQELASKVELILYCCSPSFGAYSDLGSLRQRTLNTVRSLAEKARALKMQSGTPGISLQFQQ